MSNLYFEFLARTFVGWFSQSDVQPGDRYHLILDDPELVSDFYTALTEIREKNIDVEAFDMLPDGLSFTTTVLKFTSIKLVLVATSNSISPDFLVTLRNRVAAQKGIWNGTAIVFISDAVLDSISNGAMDISSEDGPLNTQRIASNLRKDLNRSALDETEKDVISLRVDQIEVDSTISLGLMDFQPLYKIIQQGKIKTEDFASVGMFPDKILGTIDDPKARNKRLKKNSESFQRAEEIHLAAGIEDQVEKEWPLLGRQDASRLASDEWELTDFDVISQAIAKQQRTRKQAARFDALACSNQSLDSDLKLWIRTKKGSPLDSRGDKVDERKWNLLLFVSSTSEKTGFDFLLPFDSSVRQSELDVKGKQKAARQFTISAKRNAYHLNFFLLPGQSVLSFALKHHEAGIEKFEYEFQVLVLKMEPAILRGVRSCFSINAKSIPWLSVEGGLERFDLSSGEQDLPKVIGDRNELNGPIELTSGECFDFSALDFSGKSSYSLDAELNGDPLKLVLVDKNQSTLPKSALDINAIRRSSGENAFVTAPGHLSIGGLSVFASKRLQKFLQYEKVLLDCPSFCGQLVGEEVEPVELQLPQTVKDTLNQFRTAIKNAGTLPSLAIFDQEIKLTLDAFLQAIEAEISLLPADRPIPESVRAIAKIGTLQVGSIVYYSPLAPVLLMYAAQTDKAVGGIRLEAGVERQLTPIQLVPYLYWNQNLYGAIGDEEIPRWLTYRPLHQSSETTDMRQIIADRLVDFVSNFHFLLEVGSSFALHVAIYNVNRQQGVIKGTIDYFLHAMRQSERLDVIHPVELYFHAPDLQSFDDSDVIQKLFSSLTLNELASALDLNIPAKLRQLFSPRDILLTIQDNIKIYDQIDADKDYHLTFYQFLQSPSDSPLAQREMDMNYSLSGILSEKRYTKQNDLGTGFGTRFDDDAKQRTIISFVSQWNSLLSAEKTANDAFIPGNTIVNYARNLSLNSLRPIIESSDWITFVDPRLSLDMFNSVDDLYVIHYSDRDGASGLASLTVTRRIDRYDQILSETLAQISRERENPEIQPSKRGTAQIISSFNLLNGSWLLRILRHKHDSNEIREKLSIIASYKYLMGILDSPSVYWLPVSMEEVLRISGSAGLKMSEGLFSARTGVGRYSASDDILMMGIDLSQSTAKVHLLPAEVKVGGNHGNVIDKAKEQLSQSIKILQDNLVGHEDFTTNLYRHFFLALYTNNMEKLIGSDTFKQKDWERLKQVMPQLQNKLPSFDIGQYQNYGSGILVSFSEQAYARGITTLHIDKNFDGIQVDVPESDAYIKPAEDLDYVLYEVKSGHAGFDPSFIQSEEVPYSQNVPGSAHDEVADYQMQSAASSRSDLVQIENITNSQDVSVHLQNVADQNGEATIQTAITEHLEHALPIDQPETVESAYALEQSNLGIASKQVPDTIEKSGLEVVNSTVRSKSSLGKTSIDLADVRFPLGRVVGSQIVTHWEYGNTELSNRHMLITGKSGQGKTYFIQGVLREMSKNGLSSLIIDYTDSYLRSQLDDEFLDLVGDKLHINNVRVLKLPINPFQLGQISLGDGQFTTEDSYDMVERVAQTLDYVFNLGVQQKSTLVDTMMDGYEQYGDSYTFKLLKKQLSEADTSTSETLKGRLQKFLNREVFQYPRKPFDWGNYFNDRGDITVIQLTGYPDEMKSAMTEFLLWDMFNYAKTYGTEATPLPLFLDEVQNLDFSKSAPTAKILREGRKFGISGIFATQSVTSINDTTGAIWNAAIQVHFLPPDDQTAGIARFISTDSSQRKQVEQQLHSLSKGRALFNGPLIDGSTMKQRLVEINILQMNER